MFLFIIAILLVIVAIGCALFSAPDEGFRGGPIGAFLGLVAFVLLIISAVTVVSPGEVGVPIALGTASEPIGPGMHLVSPWTDIHKVSTQTQLYTLVANPTEGNKGDDTVEVRGSDQATGKVNARLTWRVPSDSATTLYKKYGSDLETKVVRAAARTCLNDAASSDSLADIASVKRGAYEHAASTCIDKEFEKAGIIFEKLSIAEITLPQDVQKAVNHKAASFSKLEAQRNTAQGARIEALGSSDSQQIIKCGGIAEKLDNGTTTIKPNANSDGSCKGATRLTPDYLSYLYIKALATNAGSKNHTVFVVPPGTNLNAILQQQGE